MERDWVPALADTLTTTQHGYTLVHLTAVMRRIDLICKLLAPIVISALISTTSTRAGIAAVGCTSLLSWPLELLSAQAVWRANPRLRQSKPPASPSQPQPTSLLADVHARLAAYFSTPVWAPSMALALLHFSPLSYSATFMTYLLSTGFSLPLITVARAVGSVVEVSSTFVAPFGVQRLACGGGIVRGDADGEEGGAGGGNQAGRLLAMELTDESSGGNDEDDAAVNRQEQETRTQRQITGLARSGLWGLTLQLGCLVCFSPFPFVSLFCFLPFSRGQSVCLFSDYAHPRSEETKKEAPLPVNPDSPPPQKKETAKTHTHSPNPPQPSQLILPHPKLTNPSHARSPSYT